MPESDDKHDALEKTVHANDLPGVDRIGVEGLDASAEEREKPVDKVTGLDERARGGVQVEVEASEAWTDCSGGKEGLARRERGGGGLDVLEEST